METFDLLYEKAMNTLPDSVQKQLSRTSVRKDMPSDSFLLPSERKFPIKRPGSSKIDPGLVYAAYVRAKQWSKQKPEYGKVAAQAKEMFINAGGPSKLKIKLESFDPENIDLKQVVTLLNNTNKLDSTPKDQSDDVEHCICINCDYECKLGIDDTVCDSKKCPKCGSNMMDSVFSKRGQKEIESEGKTVSESLKSIPNMKDKMRFLMENSKNNTDSTRKICKECDIVITMETSEFQNNICPGCGKEFTDLTESVATVEKEKHFSCPKCRSVKPYTRINEDECPVCHSLMTVFAVPEIKKDHGVPINTD